MTSHGGSPGTKTLLYTAQARCSRSSMSVKSTGGMCCQGCCSASWYSHATPCSRVTSRPRSHKQQCIAIDIIGPHALEDVRHFVHSIEHHARVHPSPFLDAGHAHLSIICRHLEICKTFVDMPQKMLIVFAKCGIEVPPKDGSKPVKKNQII